VGLDQLEAEIRELIVFAPEPLDFEDRPFHSDLQLRHGVLHSARIGGGRVSDDQAFARKLLDRIGRLAQNGGVIARKRDLMAASVYAAIG